MLGSLAWLWWHGLLGAYVTTCILIVLKLGWGPLPYAYLFVVKFVQNALDGFEASSKGGDEERMVVDKVGNVQDIVTSWAKADGKQHDVFDLVGRLTTSGVASIMQDDITLGFTPARTPTWTLLDAPQRRHARNAVINGIRWTFYAGGLVVRLGFLLPLRIALMLTALVWIVVWGVLAVLIDESMSKKALMYFGTGFARFFNCATGLVVDFEDRQHRPRASGIAVANHLSANDIMTIYSDCDDIGYTCTGQSHGGFIYPLEVMGSKLTPTLWMDRACATQRAHFQEKMLSYARNADVYPVLLFPEGFCSNNEIVLQFRKGGFGKDVAVYPLAVTQEARFGDSFWLEDTYLPYLIRCLTSWALVVRIRYLPAMYRGETEEAEDFASRVQQAIAAAIGRPAGCHDGGMKRPANRQKFADRVKEAIAAHLASAQLKDTVEEIEEELFPGAQTKDSDEEEEEERSDSGSLSDESSLPLLSDTLETGSPSALVGFLASGC